MGRRSSGSGLNPTLEIMNWDAFLIFAPNSGIEFGDLAWAGEFGCDTCNIKIVLQLNDLGLGFGLLAPLVART